MDLYELLEQIRKRPGMYLGYASLTRLHMFLHGHDFGRMTGGIPASEQDKEFKEFTPWLAKKKRIKLSVSYYEIIMFLSGQHDQAAFELFFEYFDEFRADRAKAAKRKKKPVQQEGEARESVQG